MAKLGLNKQEQKPLKSVSAPLDDDSDDEFSTATLVAEAEAAYKPQKRDAGKPNRKDVLESMTGNPLSLLLGLAQLEPGSGGQSKLTDGWASVSKYKDRVSGKDEPTALAPSEKEDTATESEEDDPPVTTLGKRPGKSVLLSPKKKIRPCVSPERRPAPSNSQQAKPKVSGK
ncbi:hypothetical protein BN14_03559 [Rhizoctonia solani AG-1 IB]|uniref:Uncharacterized protein n=1 Tax=Thanatephorus cucumeris (strain AG1-IB / isolate 7/3/14) TaxID=1108050 RepID=M5BQQ1_THACB|nr:hypothetical protein BN14_03559 [Rhizoctonia solani AG-1 IB]